MITDILIKVKSYVSSWFSDILLSSCYPALHSDSRMTFGVTVVANTGILFSMKLQ